MSLRINHLAIACQIAKLRSNPNDLHTNSLPSLHCKHAHSLQRLSSLSLAVWTCAQWAFEHIACHSTLQVAHLLPPSVAGASTNPQDRFSAY